PGRAARRGGRRCDRLSAGRDGGFVPARRRYEGQPRPGRSPLPPLSGDPRRRMSGEDPRILDLLVVGAGPTGSAVGAEAKRRGLSTLLVDQGPLCASLQAYPADLEFFTTRERL